MTQEQFDEIKDLRPFLIRSKIDRTIDCLHYLGDKAQLWYHYNGWESYRMSYDNFEKRHVLPPIKGRYLVGLIDGSIQFEKYDGIEFVNNDDKIRFWQDVPKLPKID